MWISTTTRTTATTTNNKVTSGSWIKQQWTATIAHTHTRTQPYFFSVSLGFRPYSGILKFKWTRMAWVWLHRCISNYHWVWNKSPSMWRNPCVTFIKHEMLRLFFWLLIWIFGKIHMHTKVMIKSSWYNEGVFCRNSISIHTDREMRRIQCILRPTYGSARRHFFRLVGDWCKIDTYHFACAKVFFIVASLVHE